MRKWILLHKIRLEELSEQTRNALEARYGKGLDYSESWPEDDAGHRLNCEGLGPIAVFYDPTVTGTPRTALETGIPHHAWIRRGDGAVLGQLTSVEPLEFVSDIPCLTGL
jgi:hypothetical protein